MSRFVIMLLAVCLLPLLGGVAEASGRVYYTCNLMKPQWMDISAGVTFSCPESKHTSPVTGGMHCESSCKFIRTKSSDKKVRKPKKPEIITSPPGMTRAFTFVQEGDVITVLEVKK